MTMSALLDHIQDQECVELTQQLIRIPSFLWRESEIGHWLADWLGARGYVVDLQEVPLRDGGVTHQAVGKLRGDGSGPSLMLCGHSDTSDWNGDVFRRDQWRYDPFGGELVDGKIYGLGALNMKAGLASILIAGEAIRRSGAALKGDLILAFVVAETGGGVGALHLIESGCRPDYCIVTEAGNLDVGLISVGYVQGKSVSWANSSTAFRISTRSKKRRWSSTPSAPRMYRFRRVPPAAGCAMSRIRSSPAIHRWRCGTSGIIKTRRP